MRIITVKSTDNDLIDQSAKLISRMYGRESPYAEWIVNGFRPYNAEYILTQVNNPERSLHVIIDKESVIATIILQRAKKHMIFHKFCVSLDYKGKGIGKRLMSFAEKQARKQGFAKMRIEVFSAAFKLFNYYIKNRYDKVITVNPLQEDQYIKYACRGASYGFIMLEKSL